METQYQYIPVFLSFLKRLYRSKYFLPTNYFNAMQKIKNPREAKIKNHTENVTFYLHSGFQIEKPLTKLHSAPFSHFLHFSVM